jgi:hypothetical protein
VIIKYPTIKYYVYNRLIDYYLYLLYFAYYNNFNCNYVTNYTDKTLIDEIIKNYNNINKNQQTCLYNKLLFKYNNLFCYTSHRIIIINKINLIDTVLILKKNFMNLLHHHLILLIVFIIL